MAIPIDPLPDLSQYNYDIGDTIDVVTKQNAINAEIEAMGQRINATVASINTDVQAVEDAEQNLDAAQIVHAPGSGLPNEAGSAYSRDVTTSATDTTAGRLITTGAGPAQAYKRTNIIGTVSQSGGVPTGAIIERGSNSNGEYVKFADGSIRLEMAVSRDIDQGAGTFDNPYATTPLTVNFPNPLANNTPRTISFSCALASTSQVRRRLFASAANIKNNSSEFVQAYLIGSFLPSEQVTINITVHGRWY